MTTCPSSPFSSSRDQCEALVTQLGGADTAQLDHGEVERLIETEILEVLRLLMQDHLDLRAAREPGSLGPARGSDGAVRTEVRHGSRQLGMWFGDVGVQRIALVKRGVPGGLRPLDARLNLPQGKYSEGVARHVAWVVAQTSFDTAVANIRRRTGATLAKRQAEELAVRVSGDSETAGQERTSPLDGRERRRGRRPTAWCPEEPQAHGRGRGRLRAGGVPRTPEDIERELYRSGPHKPRPWAGNKRVWASLDHSVAEVIDDAFLEAASRDMDLRRRWVAVVGGNENQLRWTE